MPLELHNVLHTPQVSNNLISVQQLCLDNDVAVESHADSYCVKEQTQHVLIQGQASDGLYSLEGTPDTFHALQHIVYLPSVLICTYCFFIIL